MARNYEVTTAKRVVSSIVAVLARLGLGHFIVLTTTGRKSGEPRAVTLAPISDEDGRYLVSPYGESGWVLNARQNPTATVRRGGRESTVRLEEITGSKPDLVKRYYEREAFARRFMDVPGEGTTDDFAAVPERFPVFRIEAI